MGNHEIVVGETGQTDYLNAFNFPNNGPTSYEGLVYYFDYSNVRVACVSSYYYLGGDYHSHDIDVTQRTWLQNSLSSASDKIKFVFSHDPAYPVSSHVGSSLDYYSTERDAFWNVLKSNQVAAYFCGHEHIYSSWFVDSMYQIISGGGGAGLYDPAPGITPDVFVSDYNYVVVDVNGTNITLTAYNLSGTILDMQVIN